MDRLGGHVFCFTLLLKPAENSSNSNAHRGTHVLPPHHPNQHLCSSSALNFSRTFTSRTAARISSARETLADGSVRKEGRALGVFTSGQELSRKRNIWWPDSKRAVWNKEPRSHGGCTHADEGALGLGSLGLCSGGALVSGAAAAVRSGYSSGSTVRADSRSRSGLSRSLLDAVQEAHKEDVAGELVHGALHQRAALRAAQLAARTEDALEAAAAKGVLAGEHFGRGVQPLEAHGALEQVQQHRLIHSLLPLQQQNMMPAWLQRG